jgi:hypothetical protein
MSEVCHAGKASGHDHEAMAGPLELSLCVAKNLNELKPSAWIYWQAVEDEEQTVLQKGNWGFIRILPLT